MKNTIYLYIFDTMADWEVSYLNAEIHSQRFFKKGARQLKIVTMGNTKKNIVTMGGLKVLPDIKIGDFNINDAVALILPGGDTWTDQIHNPVLLIAEQCLKNNILVGAICGATFGLARTGLLDKRHHTSNDLKFLKTICQNYIGEIYYVAEPAVTDRNLVTASGIAPLDFTLQILKNLDVFCTEVLDSWYQLYKTQDPKYLFDIMRLIQK